MDNVYYGCDVDANRNRKWTGNDVGVGGNRGIFPVQEEEVKEGRGRGRRRKETRVKREMVELNSAMASMKKGRGAGGGAAAAATAASKKRKTLKEEARIERRCGCGRSLPMAGQTTNGWEGSAVLYHGSVIQIGCFTLVFSLFKS